MQLQECFATPLWIYDNCDINNTVIETYVEEWKQKESEHRDANQYRPNPTGLKWRSWYLNSEDFLNCSELKKLVTLGYGHAQECFKTFGPNPDVTLEYSNSWINIIERGEYVGPHIHPTSCLLATYYVKAKPRCGNIIFMNPNPAIIWNFPSAAYNKRTPYTDQLVSVDAKESRMVFAPAHAQHYVEPSESDEDRISVILNFSFKKKNPYLTNDRNYKNFK